MCIYTYIYIYIYIHSCLYSLCILFFLLLVLFMYIYIYICVLYQIVTPSQGMKIRSKYEPALLNCDCRQATLNFRKNKRPCPDP